MSTKTNKGELRTKVLDDYWQMRADRDYTYPKRHEIGCEWCERFKPLDFRVCINCGAILQ